MVVIGALFRLCGAVLLCCCLLFNFTVSFALVFACGGGLLVCLGGLGLTAVALFDWWLGWLAVSVVAVL